MRLFNKKTIFIFIIVLFTISFSSCKNKKPKPGDQINDEQSKIDKLLEDEENTTFYKVYYNLQDGSDYILEKYNIGSRVIKPADPYRKGYDFLGWYTEKECNNLYQFTQTDLVKSIMLYAKWEKYEEIDYSYILDDYLPLIIGEDIELPRKIDTLENVSLTWTSSDPQTLSNTGIINQARVDKIVNVELEVNDNGRKYLLERECTIKAIQFQPLSETNLLFGYYSTWNFSDYTEEQLKVDVINVSFAYIYDDLTINFANISFNRFLQARKSGVRVVLSLQGAESKSGNFSLAAKTAENRIILANNIVEAIEKYHFDGIDIDWEYPGYFQTQVNKAAEAENYALLMKEIYERVKAANSDYLVTAAVPGGAEGFNRYLIKNKFGATDYLDYLHLMTYDLEASSKVYHHTALYGNLGRGTAQAASVSESVEIYQLKGVPANKIVIGIAFYGKATYPASTTWALGSDTRSGSSYRTIAYTEIYNRYLSRLNDGVKYTFDSICQAPYLYDSSTNTFITYDDPTSIRAKCRFQRENELAGVMVWELGEDKIGDLMNAVILGMHK